MDLRRFHRVFFREVKKACRQFDLIDPADRQRLAAEHGASHLKNFHRLFHDHLSVMFKRLLDCGAEFLFFGNPRNSKRRTGADRFYKQWKCKAATNLFECLFLFRLPKRNRLRHRNSRLPDDLMRPLLIHAQSRRKRITADDGNARQFKHPLQRTVLTIFTVQDREHQIHRDPAVAVAGKLDQAPRRPVYRYRDRMDRFGFCPPSILRNPAVLARIVIPVSLSCDADRYYLISVMVDIFQHRRNGLQRYFIFSGMTTKNHRDLLAGICWHNVTRQHKTLLQFSFLFM